MALIRANTSGGGSSGASSETITINGSASPTLEVPISGATNLYFLSATLSRGSVSTNPPTVQIFYADGTTPASNAVTMTTSGTNYNFTSISSNDLTASNKLIVKINSGSNCTISGTIKVIK